jgi:hypothetical protein
MKNIKQILASVFTVYFVMTMSYMFFEPEITEAASTANVYLNVTSEITLACDSSSTLVGTINSISGGTATSTLNCTITTPNSNGYNMTASENNVLRIGAGGANNQFDDYATSTGQMDFTYVDPAAQGERFGFAMATGTVAAAAPYRYSGSACNTGVSVDGNHCWNGFTTSAQKVVTTSSPSGSSGDAANFMLKAKAMGNNFLTNGQYTNILTLTATVGP